MKYILKAKKDVGAEPTPARRFYLDEEPLPGQRCGETGASARALVQDGHYALFYHDRWVHYWDKNHQEFFGIEDIKDNEECVKKVERRLHGKLMEVVKLLRGASEGRWTVEVEDQTEFGKETEKQKHIRERAKRHMKSYKGLNPGKKPKPIDNQRIGGKRKTD